MEAISLFIERTDPALRWLANAWKVLGGIGAFVAFLGGHVGLATCITAALLLLGVASFLFPLLVANDRLQQFFNRYHPAINAGNRARRKDKGKSPTEKFRERALCGQHAVTTDGRVVSHVGNPTGSFTTPNGPRSRHGERVIFLCNFCHAAGELVRLADGRQGLLHRATDGPVEVVAVHPEPTAFGK